MTELFERYGKALVRYVQSLSRSFSEADAEDVVQDTFVKVLTSIDRYRGESRWIYLKTAAHNLAQNRIRDAEAQRRDVRRERPLEEGRNVSDDARSAEEELVRREQTALFRPRFHEALRRLPELTRLCVLAKLSGKSYAEIAVVTKLSIEAVRSRLHEARKRLQEDVGPLPADIDWPEVL